MDKEWTHQLIVAYGDSPVWTVSWHEAYIPHERLCQTYRDADRLAREKLGRITLTVQDYSVSWDRRTACKE